MTDWINWKTDGMIEKDKIDKEMEYFKQQIISALYRKGLLKWYHFNDSNYAKSNISAEEFDEAVMENPRMWDEL